MGKKTTNSQTEHSRKLRAKNASAWTKKQYELGNLAKITITGKSQEIAELKNHLDIIKKKYGCSYCSALYFLINTKNTSSSDEANED